MKISFNTKPIGLVLSPLFEYFVFLAIVLLLATLPTVASGQVAMQPLNQLSKQSVADVITSHAKQNRFPNTLTFKDLEGQQTQGLVEYTFDESVHQDMADVYLKYQPDYACFVALDVETGAILNITSFIKSDEQFDNLVMRSDYPAASVFKMVTAAAGLDLGKVSPSTVLPFNGKSTTLYKSQVLRHKTNKWTRNPTLKESFAKSINTVFGRLGIYQLGAENLSRYATRFGFGQSMNTDFNLPMSKVGLDLSNQWQIAEAASGYTKDITLSPIHAAQMAAIVANDGKMVTPYMVQSIRDVSGNEIYKALEETEPELVISQESAKALRSLMTETTRIGSARKSFQGLNRYKVYRNMEIGGKTGSLTGYSPKGRHDWFVGYAEKNGRKVAYASLIINKEKWYVRSAYVARQFIYHYFTDQAEKDSITAAAE
ncbi:MAG: peptidoglycan glycosyltransferase [Arenicella sp.]|jgi:cell division protein FtsI/penicillin-binding protein 2